MWVTRVRMRREDRTSISSHRLVGSNFRVDHERDIHHCFGDPEPDTSGMLADDGTTMLHRTLGSEKAGQANFTVSLSRYRAALSGN